MSSVTAVAEKLDQVCGQFVDEFSLDPIGYQTERTGEVDDLTLCFAMSRLAITYRTPEEQQAFFEQAETHVLEAHGNPSADIHTYTSTGQMAVYHYDRNTGLVVVNNFGFPKEEVRALRASDVDALRFSIATGGIISSGLNRTLTDQGIIRLTSDIETAIQSA